MNVRRTLVSTEPALMVVTTTLATVMQIMAAKTVPLNSPAVDHHLAKTMASAFHSWSMRLNTCLIALANMDSLEKLVKLSAR
jgi:hypothetical protein